MQQKIIAQAKRFWNGFLSFTPGQKAVTIAAVLALVIGGFLFASWASKPSYAPLFTNLSPTDASSIIDKLNAAIIKILQDPEVSEKLKTGGMQPSPPHTPAEFGAFIHAEIDRWNKTIKDEGIDFEIKLPSNKFHRQIGMWAGHHFSPAGEMLDAATWNAKKGAWLPNETDEAYIKSLMQPVREPGKMASWIAPPAKGINGLPGDFEYVKL